MVYFAYIHFKLSYGIILWGHTSFTSKLLTLQKKAVRYLAGVSYDPTTPGVFYKDSCRPLFKEFSILPLVCIYIHNIILHVV